MNAFQSALRPVAVATLLLAASLQAHAEFSITGLGSLRAGAVGTSGMAPTAKSSYGLVGGNFVLFLAGSKNAGNGYSAGFGCATVATSADGAMTGWGDNSKLPVQHTWNGVFSGQENFSAQNAAGDKPGGGFAAYADNFGDTNGVFCNDEARVYLATPFGTIAAGNIINPLRAIYDSSTVDPYYGNQRTYYMTSDYRGNALRYGHAIGDLSIDLQLNVNSGNRDKTAPRDGNVFTGLVTYDFSGTVVGLGFGTGNSQAGTPYPRTGPGLTYGGTTAGFVRTSIGPVGVGISAFNGKVKLDTDTGAPTSTARDMTDLRLKLSYPTGQWNFIGIVGVEKEKGDFTGAAPWGAPVYTFVESGITSPRINITRTDLDLWAQYDIGNGVKAYGRFNTISKKYSTPDNGAASAKGTASTLEAGVQVSF